MDLLREIEALSSDVTDAIHDGRLDRDGGAFLKRRLQDVLVYTQGDLLDPGTVAALVLHARVVASMLPPIHPKETIQ